MQKAYMSALMELAEKDNRICQLLADSGTGYDELFKKNFPDRIFNFGIAEQNTIGAAAGMAAAGMVPFVFLQGAFIVYRALEFVRDDVCFQNLNVKLIGQGSGIALAGLGPSHHTTEDIAVLRSLPKLQIYSPSTPVQVRACTYQLYNTAGPCYMRIGMSDEKEYFDEAYQLSKSGQDIICVGNDGVILSTGSILKEVMDAVELLKLEGIHLTVVNVVRLKPFDKQYIMELAKSFNKFFTVEEHQIYGGLGSIIADMLTTQGLGIKIIRMGLKDTFAKGYAPKQEQVRVENGLNAENIKHVIMCEINK